MCSALLQSYWLQILVQNLLKCSTRVICRKSVLYSHVTAHVAFTPFSTVPEAMETDDSSKVSFSTCTFDDDAVSFDRVPWTSEVDLGEHSYPWLSSQEAVCDHHHPSENVETDSDVVLEWESLHSPMLKYGSYGSRDLKFVPRTGYCTVRAARPRTGRARAPRATTHLSERRKTDPGE